MRFYLLSLYLKLGTWVQLALLTFQPDDAPMHNAHPFFNAGMGATCLTFLPEDAQLHNYTSLLQRFKLSFATLIVIF